MLRSFRGAPTEALIRSGAAQAVVRAEGVREARELLLEAEIVGNGRNRIFLNRQKLPRARDLLGALRVTVFSPDDLALVKDGPGERRRYLDDLLVSLHPRHDALIDDVERILRQRNALLKQCAGGKRFDDSAALTLDVWDAKLAESGTALGDARRELVDRLGPALGAAYAAVASTPIGAPTITARYDSFWASAGLAAALAAARNDEVRRGVTLVGPHRDDLVLGLNGMPARTHASQGEQRCVALALRLAGHAVVSADTGTPPVLLLDDVFSELDPERSDALLAHLPPGQAILTSAAGLPPMAKPDAIVRIAASSVVAA
jgi:DNA replication and repair protein RecF